MANENSTNLFRGRTDLTLVSEPEHLLKKFGRETNMVDCRVGRGRSVARLKG